jgi:UPF0755 protein
MPTKVRIPTIAGVIILGAALFTLMLGAPFSSPREMKFQVAEGESLYSVSRRLEESGIIRSSLFFRGWISLLQRDTAIGLGVYEFDRPMTLGGVVGKFVRGPDEPLLSITIPEGSTTKEVADLVRKVLPAISVDTFGELVYKDKLDGYLFPSTYYPLPSFTEKDVIRVMNNTFEKEYGRHFSKDDFPKSVPSRNDVVSLAAILEGEANTQEDMRIVSGILQKRLERGMRLQVDVSEVTYRESGLPDQPISNPGIIAMDAVFRPTESPYLYYLTGKDGRMYYSKTFEEHKRNIQKYLK